MSSAGILIFIVISLLTLDLLLRLLASHSRADFLFKPAGLIALFFLAISRRYYQLEQKSLSIRRFFLAMFSNFCLALGTSILLKQGFSHHKGIAVVLLSLSPLMAMPFYYFLFGLLGTKPSAVFASLSQFRFRSILAIIISANIIFTYLEPYNLFTQFIHLLLSFIALTGFFYLASRIRAPTSYLNQHDEDYDFGSTGFLYYLGALQELNYYALLLYFVFLRHLAANLAPSQPIFIIVPFTLATLHVTTIIVTKLLFIDRSPMNYSFFEDKILPASFLMFGLSSIYQNYLV